MGPWRFAGNVGYQGRGMQRIADLEVQDELTLRLGAAYRFWERSEGGLPLELAVNLLGATAAPQPFQRANQNALEADLMASYQISDVLLGFGGVGAGLTRGYGTPDWRLFLGVRFSSGRDKDTDKDGVLDADDKCPREAGLKELKGCPARDQDGDGMADHLDKCPEKAEDKDSFEDGDGCPDPDYDKDGVPDSNDSCPLVAGIKELKGCPARDQDGDGISDHLDKCVDQAEDKDGFEDDDGCPDLDNDKDGVVDKKDRCPLEAGVVENAGCPDKDRDGDTVVDRLDNCPDEPGSPKNAGCKEKQLVKITERKLVIVDRVYFDTDKATIQTRSYVLLDNVAAVIKSHPEAQAIRIEGHTDDRGDGAYNMQLSQRRAEAVRDYISNKGVPAARLKAQGFGETRPLVPNTSPKNRATNRRVDFVFEGTEEIQTPAQP
jgi:outer membrane protein OmpA-like peptidoglycan-associated protein